MRRLPVIQSCASAALLAVLSPASAQPIVLTFDDITSLSEYAPLGVTFSANASLWSGGGGSVLDDPDGGPYDVPNALQFGNAGGVLGDVFLDIPQVSVTEVSVWALSGPGPDLLSCGMCIRAYDDADQLLDEDAVDCLLQYDLLTVTGSGIRRIEAWSPSVANDVWDHMVILPEPSALSLLALAAVAAIRRRRR